MVWESTPEVYGWYHFYEVTKILSLEAYEILGLDKLRNFGTQSPFAGSQQVFKHWNWHLLYVFASLFLKIACWL